MEVIAQVKGDRLAVGTDGIAVGEHGLDGQGASIEAQERAAGKVANELRGLIIHFGRIQRSWIVVQRECEIVVRAARNLGEAG